MVKTLPSSTGSEGLIPGRETKIPHGMGMWSRSGASLVAQMVKNLLAMQETWVQSLGWEDTLEEGMATTSVSLPGELHGQRSLVGTVHGVTKSWTGLSN